MEETMNFWRKTLILEKMDFWREKWIFKGKIDFFEKIDLGRKIVFKKENIYFWRNKWIFKVENWF